MSSQSAIAGEELARLRETWNDGGGLIGFLSTVDHLRIGLRYIVTSLVFFALAGLTALLMRLQLARPENDLVGPDLYNQLFTLHGTTMMFLFAVPVMQGLGVYVVPLMIGTRNVAFPRLNVFAYYMFLIGGVFLYVSFAVNMAPDAGWFSYVPLAGPEFSPGKRVDVWAQLITFSEISSLGTAVSLITTILKHRAPGMSLDRLPLFAWAQLVTSFMVVFAMPAVMVASSLLALDRLVGTHFFNPSASGDVILWQHLFWFFGHPEVYIIFLPALGVVSSIVIAFSRRAVFGYSALVLSLVSTAMIGFGLWVHHMFTTGLPELGQSFFTAASMIIAIPTGVQLFCWIATLWGGRPRFASPLWFVLAFFAIFVLGGLSGVMLAAIPLNTQVHDTFFVVAHFHYVLIGGAVFPLLGGLHYWFPKFTGRALHETLAKWTCAVTFVGFNVTFFPLHQLGLHGMPRRVYTYPPGTGWSELNLISTIGAFVLGAGLLLMMLNVWRTLRGGQRCEDPWHGDSLEWATDSPPPPHKFPLAPVVSSRYPRWDAPPRPGWVLGLSTTKREILVTQLLDGAPDHKTVLPHGGPWPLLVAMAAGVTIITCIYTPWGLPLGSLLLAVTLAGWFWPQEPYTDVLEER